MAVLRPGLGVRSLISGTALWLCACSGGNTAATNADLAGTTPDGSTASGDMSGPPVVITGVHATQAQGRYFPDAAPWYRDVSAAPLAPDSAAITNYMLTAAAPNGWVTGKLKVDFSIAALNVPSGTAKRAYQIDNGFYYTPDCDRASVPLPAGGVVEDYPPPPLTTPFSGYNCSGFAGGSDCHILLVARAEKRVYELYHGTVDSGGAFRAGCLAIWDTTANNPNGRGQQCTSADAAGFPVSALLFSADEIKAGVIDHAIRFILPNSMIRAKKYVAPATHGTNTTGPATAGPYGFRMRLKASYPVNTLSPAAQVVARALQKYGMLMADGGNVTLTAQSDQLSTVKWADVGFDANSLQALKATDFEVIDYGTPTDVNFNCTRQQIIEP